MDAVELKPGWLEQQVKETQAEVSSWPAAFQLTIAAAGNQPQAPAEAAATADDTPPTT